MRSSYSKAVATSKQSYKYLLFGLVGFSQSFSDVVQNIISATYKGQVGGVGGQLRLAFRHNGTICVPKELPMVSKPHYKAKQAIQ